MWRKDGHRVGVTLLSARAQTRLLSACQLPQLCWRICVVGN
ncbi:rCG58145 [Rattus norvegicus]|uniref:RCG58145 n=1 Tax=Rattus norvegicus TaxID=10116 RepID=A6J483_RAT|nr:rCG58145 [Rattus norvegicus]